MICRHDLVRQEQGMLDKLSKGWFRLYGNLQQRALAHGGELLYEVDLSAGASVMWAGSAWNPYSVSLLLGELAVHGTHTAGLCYWVFISFVPKTDKACLCYSVFCALDVPDSSCVARKESVFFVEIVSWTIRASTTESKSKRPLDTAHCVRYQTFGRPLRLEVQYHALVHCFWLPVWHNAVHTKLLDTAHCVRYLTFGQQLTLEVQYHVIAIVHCFWLPLCFFLWLIVATRLRSLRCTTCSQITSALRG